MDAGPGFIREMNYVLDRSDFEVHIVRTISKAENTSKHEHNQQYGPSHQSDMTSNAIRTNPGVVTVTSPVALTRRPET